MLGFLVAIGAGFITPHLDGPVAKPLMTALGKWIEFNEAETRLVSFMAAMIGAGVLANLLNSGATFWVILGGVLGYFITRIVAAAKTVMDQRQD